MAYHDGSFEELFPRLGDAGLGGRLSKAELLTIFNLRPAAIPVLNNIIEDLDERFSEDEQRSLLRIIAEVLGQNDPTDPTILEQDVVPSTENGH